MRKKSTTIILYIVGIIFIIGGVVSILSSINNVLSKKTATYTRIVESNVVSIKIEENWADYSDLDISIAQNRTVWTTLEEVVLDGKTLTFEQKYYSDPGTRLTHCIISNDGINWKINDSDEKDIAVSCAAGIICFLFGGAILRFVIE